MSTRVTSRADQREQEQPGLDAAEQGRDHCVAPLHRAAEGPADPLGGGPQRAEPGTPAAPGQVVGDLLGRELQAEERVDAGEVAAEGGRAGGVHARRRRCAVPCTSKVRSTSSRPSGLRPAPPWSSRSASTRCSAMSASRPVQSMMKSDVISRVPPARLHDAGQLASPARAGPPRRCPGTRGTSRPRGPRRICCCQLRRFGRVGAAHPAVLGGPRPRPPAGASWP